MQKKNFNEVFQRYFHTKYLIEDFYKTKPIVDLNFKMINYKKHTTMSYNLDSEDARKLKNYHTFLNNIIFKYLPTSSNVYSYKPNHNIFKMLTNHKDSKYYFKTDIHNFFESITRKVIIDCIEENQEFLSIERLDCELISTIVDIVTFNNILPAGFVSSPSISNVVLYKFDKLIEDYCKSKNINYSRYSDDLVFSSNNKIENIENIINNIFKEYYDQAFVLNKEKSKYIDKTNIVRILGVVITPDGHITVPRDKKDKIRKLLYFYMNDKDKFNSYLKENYDNSLSKAYGTLNYIKDIDNKFIYFLRKKYGSFAVDKFLHGKKS